MKISDVMTHQVQTCGLHDSLNEAARIMWQDDCGALPVVDDDGHAVAMITDRDICMAAYTRGQPLRDADVASAASHGIATVKATDSVEAAEAVMQKYQIRRVPVVDAEGKPVGMVSINDLARESLGGGRKRAGLGADTIVRTLAAISEPNARREHVAQ